MYIHITGWRNRGNVWGAYTFALGFLIVFRNNQAYSRTLAPVELAWKGLAMRNGLPSKCCKSFPTCFQNVHRRQYSSFCMFLLELSTGVRKCLMLKRGKWVIKRNSKCIQLPSSNIMFQTARVSKSPKGSARGISLLKFKIYTKGCAWMEHPTVDRTGFLRTTSEVPFWYETWLKYWKEVDKSWKKK